MNQNIEIEVPRAIRFGDREKQILFGLFHKYEHIIDYRQRKNTIQKQSDVRKCWETIMRTFNGHPETNKRTLKQLQKFWLNSKLRKLMPPNFGNDTTYNENTKMDSDDFASYVHDETDSNSMKDQSNSNQNDINLLSIHQFPRNPIKLSIKNVSSLQDNDDNFMNSSSENIDIESSTKHHLASANGYDYEDDDDIQLNEHLKQSEENDNFSTINNHQHEDTMNLLVQEEMTHRVKESKYRCELQLMQLEKAREELKHLRETHTMELAHKREMNRLELQSAKIRYDNLTK